MRREYKIEDPFQVYLLMGDIAIWTFLYSVEVKCQQGLKKAHEQLTMLESRIPTCNN